MDVWHVQSLFSQACGHSGPALAVGAALLRAGQPGTTSDQAPFQAACPELPFTPGNRGTAHMPSGSSS